MKRQKLLIVTSSVMAIYGIAIFVGFILSIYRPELYGVYKDLAVLIIATPAAYLAYSFQKRTEYMKTLRDLWSHMVDSVQKAFEYTYTTNPPHELYSETLLNLSIAIEEVRGVFKNVGEKDGKDGKYPFEPLKDIYEEIRTLGFDQEATIERQREARKIITDQWHLLRSRFLLEFDRDFPTYPASRFLIEAE